MTDIDCPVCGRDGARIVGNVEDRDAITITCPRCKTFSTDALVKGFIESELRDQRHRLAYAVNAAADRGEHVFLDADIAQQMVSTAPKWTTLDEGIDRFLLALAVRVRRYTTQIDFDGKLEYVRVPCVDDGQYNDLYALACDVGYLDRNTRRITVDGWRRLEALRSIVAGRRQAFVALWFAKEMIETWDVGFAPGVERSGYFSAFRVDRKEHNNRVDDEIIAEIRRSGLLVADFTGDRGGVYYEAGLASGLGIPVILTCRKDYIRKVHFDTRQINHIVWQNPEELALALDRRIRATVVPPSHLRASA